VLRSAGLKAGTDRVQLALQALQITGLHSRRDFHATLAACFVDRAENRALFDQAFHIFWRDPDLLGRVMAMMLPKVQARHDAQAPPENRRLASAMFPNQSQQQLPQQEQRIEVEASTTWSDREVLRKTDFDTMSAAEWQQAKRLVAELELFFERRPTRRMRRANSPGRADWRATMQAMARNGQAWSMRWQRPRVRPVPLVVLADISGSMSRYSRMLLHFAHALANADLRVHSFVFGTRLTNITRHLRQRDPDLAIARVVRTVPDWSGGTRLAENLHRFNQDWSRRVLAGDATLLLITDGLAHGETASLGFEIERLHKSCRRLVWLNPLLRFDGFEPRAAGIRTMLPHVDLFLPAHNIESLQALARTLVHPPTPDLPGRAWA
jgi:uncharacterized protein with von Willebrand factor type A (vWA) domain